MSVKRRNHSGHGPEQDFEINLAPIVDCFTVLITFILISASFLSIGILEANNGSPGQSDQNQPPPDEIIQIEVQNQLDIEIKITGKANETIRIPQKNTSLDLERLSQELTVTQQKWPKINSVILKATDDVNYVQIIRSMEAIKVTHPSILLGGY